MLFFLGAASGSLNAQCPVNAGFQMQDTVCANATFGAINTSSGNGSLQYAWDFCSGDLKQTPAGSVVATAAGLLGQAYGFDLVQDNGNWYGFAVGFSNNLVRFDFGASLGNAPVPVSLGNPGSLFVQSYDVKFIKDNGNWHAFVSNFSSKIVRLDFDSINDPVPAATDLSVPAGILSGAEQLQVKYDNGEYFILVCNYFNAQLSVIEIGSVITNNIPTAFNVDINGGMGAFNPISVSIDKECGTWYAFVGFYNSAIVQKADFGTSLHNTTPVISTLNITGNNTGFYSCLKNEGGEWYLCEMGGSNVNFLKRIDFGPTLNNQTPALVQLGTLNGLFDGDYSFKILNDSSRWHGFALTNNSNLNLKHFVFPDTCNSSITYSNDSLPALNSYTNAGTYYVSLSATDTNGNTAYYSDSVYMSALPRLTDFVASPGCEGELVLFNDLSSVCTGSIIKWLWDFGDTIKDTVANPTHFYTSGGIFNVTLTTYSSDGDSITTMQSISISPKPQADFTFVNNACKLSSVQFSDLSLPVQDSLVAWLWYFGDGDSAIVQSPQHSYQTDGNFNVILIVTGSTGCKDTLVKSISILPLPIISFSVANTCINETAQFTNSTTISDTSSLSYSWLFGDNNFSSAISPSHQYPNGASNYTVQLLALSTNGCSDSLQQNIRIGNQPIPWFTFSPDTACVGNAISFFDSSYVASGDTITNLYWDFGDNSYDSISINPVHLFQSSGLFNVTLTVTSPTHCDTVITRQVFVIASPTAEISFTNTCFGDSLPFTDLSLSSSGTSIAGWQWSFGDTTSSSLQNPQHFYSAHGNYNVFLQVTSSSGCVDTISKNVQVYELPQVAFSNTLACAGSIVNFTDNSTIATSSINGWKWDFGDGTTSTNQNTSHAYTVAGIYSVKLIVSTVDGCSDSLSKNIFVNISPKFAISSGLTCFQTPTQFQYIPLTSDSLVNVTWNFGDSTFSPVFNPLHLFTSIDTFLITLTVTGINGCSTINSTSVIVHPLPVADFAITNPCSNSITQFNNNSTVVTDSIVANHWTFAGIPFSTDVNPTVQLNAGGYYTQLNVITNAGCKDSSAKTVFIYNPPPVQFISSTSFGTPLNNTLFTNTTVGSNNVFWDFGDNTLIETDSLINHAYADTGIYSITLTAVNMQGCSDTIQRNFNVIYPALDIAVKDVTATQTNGLLTFKVTLLNAGNVDITKVELVATGAGLPELHEFATVNLPVSAPQILHTFGSSIQVNADNMPGYFCVEAINPNNGYDIVSSNNVKCKALLNDFEIVNITPNPATSEATINMIFPAKGIVSIHIYSSDGKLMSAMDGFAVAKGFNSVNVNVTGWSNELYAVEAEYIDQIKVRKFIKQ